jgi:hypothetical protein
MRCCRCKRVSLQTELRSTKLHAKYKRHTVEKDTWIHESAAAPSVIFKMDVQEGSQFHMGRFTTKGFPEAMDKALRERWALKTGDVFDDGYAMEFGQKQMNEITRTLFLERRAQNKSAPNLRFENKVDRANLTVDITLTLTN